MIHLQNGNPIADDTLSINFLDESNYGILTKILFKYLSEFSWLNKLLYFV